MPHAMNSVLRFTKHLEDSSHHERYRDSVLQFGGVDKVALVDVTKIR